MARTPQTNAAKKLHGVRPSRLNTSEVSVLPGPPEPPAWLSEPARAHWADVVPTIAPNAVAAVDASALGMFCEALADYLTARAIAEDEPYTLDEHGRPRRHPAHMVRDAASARLLAWARELGLTPAARARMANKVPAAEPEKDPAARLLFTPPLTARRPSA